jgi:dihydrofolate reductase
MRNLIVTNIVSLDGYCAGPGGNVWVMPMDQSFDAYNAERLRAADTLLLGRTSYEMFNDFWPEVADDAAAAETNREISRSLNAIEKFVVSDSITADRTAPWRDTTRIARRADAHEQIAELAAPLRLLDTRTREGSGNVLVRYAVATGVGGEPSGGT